jgi:hypothetical protein
LPGIRNFLRLASHIFLGTFVSFLKDEKIGVLRMSSGLAVVVIGTGLLLFAFVSSFLGFLLGALSNVVVEKFFWRGSALNFPRLVEFLGLEDGKTIQDRFKRQFGSVPKEDKYGALNRSSFLCAFYLWRVDPTLADMQGRLDAELVATQSFVFVSIALMLAVPFQVHYLGWSIYMKAWSAVLALIFLASTLAFDYHREKRVFGRFGFFLAVTNPLQPTSEPQVPFKTES